MSKSTQRKARDSDAASKPSKAALIRDSLKTMLQTFPQKELFPEEVENWVRDLDPFLAGAIEWAFDNWRRNGRFFPVYGDILDQCIGWEPIHAVKPVCDIECRSHHQKGYHWNDMLWLMTKLQMPCVVGPRSARKEPVKAGEIDTLLAELDAKRPAGAPEWRR